MGVFKYTYEVLNLRALEMLKFQLCVKMASLLRYGQDILYGISKVPFEIPHKISCPYIERCAFYFDVEI